VGGGKTRKKKKEASRSAPVPVSSLSKKKEGRMNTYLTIAKKEEETDVPLVPLAKRKKRG